MLIVPCTQARNYVHMYVETTYIQLTILFNDAVSYSHCEYRNGGHKTMSKNEDNVVVHLKVKSKYWYGITKKIYEQKSQSG